MNPIEPRVRLWALFLPLLAIAACCGGPDPLRHAAEREALALTQQLADDYFAGKPIPDIDTQRIVRGAIDDIAKRLEIDAASLTTTTIPVIPPAPPTLPPAPTEGGN